VKVLSGTVANHVDDDVTKLATCFKLTRRDGVIMGFCDHDQILTVGGVNYQPDSGFLQTMLRKNGDMSKDNADIFGFLESPSITAADVRNGIYNGARFEIFKVIWDDVTAGTIKLLKGEFGAISLKQFKVEVTVEGLSKRLATKYGKIYQPQCRVDLFSEECGLDAADFVVAETVDASTANSVDFYRSFNVPGLVGTTAIYKKGLITVTSGLNINLSMEVKNFDATTGKVELFARMPYLFAAGDTFNIYPGCDKKRTTCSFVYSNIVNFRGEPDVPHDDVLLLRGNGVLTTGSGSTGGTTVPGGSGGTGGGTPLPGSGGTVGGSTGSGTPVISNHNPAIGSTIAFNSLMANNTSASSQYNKDSSIAEVRANFTGSYVVDGSTLSTNSLIYDNSLNASMYPFNGSVSKINIRELLYSGATTKIWAHFMPWFRNPKGGGHINVGYSSDNQTQVNLQISDAKSRGIQGFVIDWYGQANTHHDNVAKKVKAGCEATSGFEFVLCYDVGAIKNVSDRQATTISDLNYILATYAPSAKYGDDGGVPIIHFFGLEAYESQLNWVTIRAALTGSAKFIFRNAVAIPATYADGESDGGYAWLDDDADTGGDPGAISYLTNFYTVATNPTHAAQKKWGSAYAGFNGTLTAFVAWSKNKHISQQGGLTWLQTFQEINSFFNSGNQLEHLMLVTWNDYEEGSALELGIQNNVSVDANRSGTTLTWTTSGDEDTVYQYVVYITSDQQTATVIAKVNTTDPKSVNLATAAASFEAGAYFLAVFAVGQPCMRNHLSDVIPWTKT
jgi:uncharacterized phage protein (TIGR02218 family)